MVKVTLQELMVGTLAMTDALSKALDRERHITDAECKKKLGGRTSGVPEDP